MSAVVYPALASGDHASGYTASFPDLPGCTAHALSLSDLLIEAREAVRAALKALEQARQDWPEPTPLETLRERDGLGSGVGSGVLMLVDVQVDDTPVRVNISIGERLLKRIDQAAEASSMTRSGYVAAAARTALGDKAGRTAGGTTDFEGVARRLQEELTSVGRKINDSLGPHSAFTRNMAELDDRFYDTIRRTADTISAAVARRKSHEAADAASAQPHGREANGS